MVAGAWLLWGVAGGGKYGLRFIDIARGGKNAPRSVACANPASLVPSTRPWSLYIAIFVAISASTCVYLSLLSLSVSLCLCLLLSLSASIDPWQGWESVVGERAHVSFCLVYECSEAELERRCPAYALNPKP